MRRPKLGPLAAIFLLAISAGLANAQTGSRLPPTAPTGATAPIAAVATSADRAGSPHHRAHVTCAAGQLEVRADNSSLNGILRSISRCTGMKITGGVADERVFGNYGPASPSTVLATLLDGTGTNMLLLETVSNEPAELILSPRTGGPTPPSPNQVPDDDTDAAAAPAQPQPALNQPSRSVYATTVAGQPANPTPASPAGQGSAVTTPPVMPPPINNVNGSSTNKSPSVGTYPTTNSVPLDTLPTPYTTPSASGIVDSPNPPPAGSDTAKLLNGSSNVPGSVTITPAPTSNSTTPGGTNTATPAPGTGTSTPPASNGALTPQQVYQQLQQMQRSQQSQPAPAPASNPQ